MDYMSYVYKRIDKARKKKSPIKKHPKYIKLKRDFINYANANDAIGTCVLGSGTFVKKGGKDVDFISNPNQSEQGLWKAEKKFEEEFKRLGLEIENEAGFMD